MPYTTLRSTRAWALAASHTPRRSTPETSRGSRCWIFMSATPSLDALLGAAIGSGGPHHGGSIAPSRYGLKRVISCGGSGAGRRVLRVDVHPGPPARGEDNGDATTSYLSAFWISSGVRANTVPAIVSEARPVNLTIEWCFFPLSVTVASSSISTVVSAKPGSTSRSPDNRRPKVASCTASSCSVPYEKRNSVLSMATCRSADLSIAHEGTSSRRGARRQLARRPRDDSGRGTLQRWRSACAERTLASAE